MRKATSISSIKKRLWLVFSLFIRARDKYTCVLCGSRSQQNASHYIAKAACNPEYYFSETNVNSCCVRCNMWLEGNRPAYREFIINKYGADELKNIEMNYNRSIKWDIPKYQEKIDYYSKKIKEL